MLKPITAEVLPQIKSAALREFASIYINIERDFIEQIATFGLPLADEQIDEQADEVSLDDASVALASAGICVANNRSSFAWGWISPACISCRTGVGSATFTISTKCSRSCFFCFNPNQDNYERLLTETDDVAAQLRDLSAHGGRLSDIALTGGEPLLFKPKTEEFFSTASELFPDAHTRIYTSGDHLDEAFLLKLKQAGLQEMRFSIKTDDPPKALGQTLTKIALAKKHLPYVVVEMPVMPDELQKMQELLLGLDAIGISGINLLELCFPFNNVEEFARRGYKLKARPFRVLYNYWYAGGLPIADSEAVCLELLRFAAAQNLRMGVHYCSLENKFSGQIYQQNYLAAKEYPYCSMSKRDHFLKSAKIFGADIPKALKLFKKRGFSHYIHTKADGTGCESAALGGRAGREAAGSRRGREVLEFKPGYIAALADELPNAEVAISYHVLEADSAGVALKELRLDLTTPTTFDTTIDL